MRNRWLGLERIEVRRRLAAGGVATVVAVFLLWFFLFRTPPGATPPAGSPPSRPALGQVISYESYASAVGEALADVRTASAVSGDARKKAVQAASKALEKVEGADIQVEGAIGAAEIDNRRILSALSESDPKLEGIESSLATLNQELTNRKGEYQAGTLPGDRAESELKSVLSDAAFNYEQQLSPLQRLARWLSGVTGQADPGDTLWRWITALVAGLAAGIVTFLSSSGLGNIWVRLGLSALVGLVAGGLFFDSLGALGTTIEVLGAVGLVVAAVAVALIFSGVGRASTPARPRGISELAVVLGMSAGEARHKAEEAASAGDYHLAIRYRCLAVLLTLDEAGMLHFDRAATNREYLFRAQGALHDELQPLLDRFDAIWYGGAPTSQEEWQGYNVRSTAIESRVAAQVGTQPGGRKVQRSPA
ncbi:MAG: DUF4129 domain-containing protein [Chloroflexi bacterium]|nr:DUF4129 domain-containing protein [Chloroflexota bacterium]